MRTSVDLLVAATTRRWVADHLAGNTAVPVVHDHGLDAPDLPGLRVAWWTPTEHAARLRRVGVPFTPQSPGPRWLADLEEPLLARTVWAGPLGELPDGPGGWFKLAEAKHPNLPAAWYDSPAAFTVAADRCGIGTDSWVQVTGTRLDLDVEYRFFVSGQTVTGGSWYLAGGRTWDPDTTPGHVDLPSAASYAHDVVTHLGSGQPDGYVLDVASTRDGRWLVLEGNPCWSANPYGTPADAVVSSVSAAFTGTGWSWAPDPYLLRYAAVRRPLPLCRPVWLEHLEAAGVVAAADAATVPGDQPPNRPREETP